MEEKFIEKEDILHMLRELLGLVMISEKTDYNDGAVGALTLVIKVVEDASDADVEPIYYGEWTAIEEDDDCLYQCSFCGEEWSLYDGTPINNGMNYCPNCGADMRGKAKLTRRKLNETEKTNKNNMDRQA